MHRFCRCRSVFAILRCYKCSKNSAINVAKNACVAEFSVTWQDRCRKLLFLISPRSVLGTKNGWSSWIRFRRYTNAQTPSSTLIVPEISGTLGFVVTNAQTPTSTLIVPEISGTSGYVSAGTQMRRHLPAG